MQRPKYFHGTSWERLIAIYWGQLTLLVSFYQHQDILPYEDTELVHTGVIFLARHLWAQLSRFQSLDNPPENSLCDILLGLGLKVLLCDILPVSIHWSNPVECRHCHNWNHPFHIQGVTREWWQDKRSLDNLKYLKLGEVHGDRGLGLWAGPVDHLCVRSCL